MREQTTHTGLIWIKKHVAADGSLLIAACDESLLDSSQQQGDIVLECPSSFFKGELVSVETLQPFFVKAMYFNLVGELCVRFAVDAKLATDDDCRSVQGIPYLYISRFSG